jgi:hypothetical protein
VLTFLAVVFLVLAFLAVVFFAGIVASLTPTAHSAYFFALGGSRKDLALHVATRFDVSSRRERS